MSWVGGYSCGGGVGAGGGSNRVGKEDKEGRWTEPGTAAAGSRTGVGCSARVLLHNGADVRGHKAFDRGRRHAAVSAGAAAKQVQITVQGGELRLQAGGRQIVEPRQVCLVEGPAGDGKVMGR